MKGRNEIKLNQSSMIQAIQYWLNSILVETDITVTKVDSEMKMGVAEFTIEIEKRTREKQLEECQGQDK